MLMTMVTPQIGLVVVIDDASRWNSSKGTDERRPDCFASAEPLPRSGNHPVARLLAQRRVRHLTIVV